MKKKNIWKVLAIVIGLLYIGSISSCKAGDCNCPKFSIKSMR